MVDTYALGAYASQRAGSSPVPGTKPNYPSRGGFFVGFYERCYNLDMEQRILAYEKFIKKAAGGELNEKERERLSKYHFEMMESLQHERLCHLLVMLFFVLFSLAFILFAAWLTVNYGLLLEMLPLYIMIGILAVLTGFYVKHYYFLENHIQKLYDYTAKLSGIKDAD